MVWQPVHDNMSIMQCVSAMLVHHSLRSGVSSQFSTVQIHTLMTISDALLESQHVAKVVSMT